MQEATDRCFSPQCFSVIQISLGEDLKKRRRRQGLQGGLRDSKCEKSLLHVGSVHTTRGHCCTLAGVCAWAPAMMLLEGRDVTETVHPSAK